MMTRFSPLRTLCTLLSLAALLPTLAVTAADAPALLRDWNPPTADSLRFWVGFLFVSIVASVSLLYAWWKKLL